MLTEKLSISIPHNLVDFIDHYRQNYACKSKSQVIQKALKLLQQQELEQYYLQANAEIDPIYNKVLQDGLEHDTQHWLNWITQLQAIAQNGLAFTQDKFDKERYQILQQLTAEIASHVSEIKPEKLLAVFTAETGYATPKIDVRGAVFKDHKILLVKECADNRWTLPGGFADIGLSPAECVVKEIWEESGYETQVKKLIALFDKRKHVHPPELIHYYKVFFLCEITGGNAIAGIETSEVAFFAEDELPPLSLGRVTPSQIHCCFQHYYDPARVTEFD